MLGKVAHSSGRTRLPLLVGSGARVVAPDLFGFGWSDKPADDGVCTCSFNRESSLRFVEHLDLRDVTRVCQDRGGILGLNLPIEMPRRFARLLVMNTRAALAAWGRTPAAGR